MLHEQSALISVGAKRRQRNQRSRAFAEPHMIGVLP
jgi:hypothetical protein